LQFLSSPPPCIVECDERPGDDLEEGTK
jgi:hypothetical protein